MVESCFGAARGRGDGLGRRADGAPGHPGVEPQVQKTARPGRSRHAGRRGEARQVQDLRRRAGLARGGAGQRCDQPGRGHEKIVSILPEGTKVKKGELVGELDSASLRDQLINQKIATKAAEAAYQNAKLAREVAEIAVKEYEEGIYVQDGPR